MRSRAVPNPASPVYTVTRAEGNVVFEIDGERATDWYARFFTVAGALAPLPATAQRFPLILEGPAPERQGVYRTMRAFDAPPGAVTFWESLAAGDRVRLGIGGNGSNGGSDDSPPLSADSDSDAGGEFDNAVLRNLLDHTARAYEEQVRLALQFAHQATHDELTGLLNRATLGQHLQRAIDDSRRDGSHHALCYIDLDQLKLINDTCGHSAGDELLRRVAALLQDLLVPGDVAARLGADEFGLLLPGTSAAEAEARLGRFHHALATSPYIWQEKSFGVSASIGVVPVTRQGKSVAQLFAAADHACNVAKEKGRNRTQVYHEDDAEFVRRHDEMSWVVRIHETLRENRFRLFAQQIRPLTARAGAGLHFEVLLRMEEEDGRLRLPADFIRAAERYGLMRAIDRWVVRHCAETLSAQSAAFLAGLGTCAINLSAISLGDETFLAYVLEQFSRFPVAAEKICFEITETAAIENLPQAVRLLTTLAGHGFRFALDDFGTGMSSFSYLKEIPVSILKIDGKFIQDLVTDPLDRAMVESINQVGHVMGLQTVAEGVASGAVLERLQTLGIDYAQGNWIGPPRPLQGLCPIPLESRIERIAGARMH